MIIGIHGVAHSGKDTLGDYLAAQLLKQGQAEVYRVAFADPFKRFAQDVFQFDDEQVWGTNKEKGDARYVRMNGELLSPRRVLQTMGTDISRLLYEGIWVAYVQRVFDQLLAKSHIYTQKAGLTWRPKNMGQPTTVHIIVSDVRHDNEAALIKKYGGVILQIVRKSSGLQGEAAKHTSEKGIAKEYIDEVIDNNATLQDLEAFATLVLEGLQSDKKETVTCGSTDALKNGPTDL